MIDEYLLEDINRDSLVQQQEEQKAKESPEKEMDQETSSDGEAPLLYVDVNLGANEQRRIVVYEGDTAEVLSAQFCQEHDLDEDTREKLE